MLALALVAAAFLPSNGVLVSHQSLAGVQLGDTQAQVRTRFGSNYTVCKSCSRPTWFYFRRTGFAGDETGLGLAFTRGRVTAVFTLGAPEGWRTKEGLKVGDDQMRMTAIYGRAMRATECAGFMAHSRRGKGRVTTIFTAESHVYGFALTRPGDPVCL